MLSDEQVRQYHAAVEGCYEKALEDVGWALEQSLKKDPNGAISRIYTSSSVSHRVKSADFLLRKCRRDGIESLSEIPEQVEDILGIRIATPNKQQARELFECLRAMGSDWFCAVETEPKFVPYTVADGNKYAVKSGYQAYHITFLYHHDFAGLADVKTWPVEIQIMAKLWEFWANYSREYFYGGAGEKEAQLIPYTTAVSKILDTADDLLIATTEILLGAASEVVPCDTGAADDLVEPEEVPVGAVTAEGVREWFRENVERYFGDQVRVPIDLFLWKVADALNLQGLELADLSSVMDDASTTAKYEAILRASHVRYLPPYQSILCRLLIHAGLELSKVVSRVNEEMTLQGIRLSLPLEAGGDA